VEVLGRTVGLRDKWQFFGYMILAVGPFMIMICARYLLSDRVVLRIDAHGIEYKTLFGTQRAQWRDFNGHSVLTVEGAAHLKLDFGRGFFGNCKISEKLLELRVGGIEPMMAQLRECMHGAAALDRGDYHHASLGGRPAPAAREQPAPAAPQAMGFGRKGL